MSKAAPARRCVTSHGGFSPQVARKTKQKASDDEDAGAEASEAEGGTSTGPAQLAALKALPYVPREQELCDVCGSGEGWDG